MLTAKQIQDRQNNINRLIQAKIDLDHEIMRAEAHLNDDLNTHFVLCLAGQKITSWTDMPQTIEKAKAKFG